VRDRSFRQGATSWLDDLIFKVRARKVLSKLPVPASVVADLGSGYDARFLRFARQIGRIEAGIVVDVSLDASRPDDAIQLIEADLSAQLPIADSSVAATTSLAVLEHLEQPAVHVSEMHRILRRGGVAIITTPSVRSKKILELLAFRLHVIDADEIRDHKHYYTERELRTLLVRAGFADDAITYRSFSLGMNQLVVATKAGVERDESEEQGELVGRAKEREYLTGR
jgi:SAM-dependent methyltransferase